MNLDQLRLVVTMFQDKLNEELKGKYVRGNSKLHITTSLGSEAYNMDAYYKSKNPSDKTVIAACEVVKKDLLKLTIYKELKITFSTECDANGVLVKVRAVC